MRKLAVILLVSFLGLVFQSSLIKGIYPSAVVPDVLVIVAIFLILQSGGIKALLACFLLGLLADLAAGVYLGPQAAGYVLTYFVTVILSKSVLIDRGLGISFLAFFATLSKSATALLIYLTYLGISTSASTVNLGQSSDLVGVSSHLSGLSLTLFLEALFTAIIAAPLFYLIAMLVGGRNVSPGAGLSADMRIRKWAKQG